MFRGLENSYEINSLIALFTSCTANSKQLIADKKFLYLNISLWTMAHHIFESNIVYDTNFFYFIFL